MLLVVTVDRGGNENTVTAEFLDLLSGETTQFRCRSAEPVLEPGDFVNMKGKEISFLHKPTLTPITFLAGSIIIIPKNVIRPPSPPRPPAPPKSPPRPATRKATLPRPATRPANNPADYSRAPMTDAEKVHFHSGKVRRAKLFARLDPVVKAYAREQSRKPAEGA